MIFMQTRPDVPQREVIGINRALQQRQDMTDGAVMILMTVRNEHGLDIIAVGFQKRCIGKTHFHSRKIIAQKAVSGINDNNPAVNNIGKHIKPDFLGAAQSNKINSFFCKTFHFIPFYANKSPTVILIVFSSCFNNKNPCSSIPLNIPSSTRPP